MTEVVAREQLEDNVMLGTMMLERNEVDGTVSGAVHTTANTIRPPLQLIKTAPNSSLVSSVFFMLLPEQVLVYGDCAINPIQTRATGRNRHSVCRFSRCLWYRSTRGDDLLLNRQLRCG